jgi:hypothetical protein
MPINVKIFNTSPYKIRILPVVHFDDMAVEMAAESN